jgi:hypothetical protein
MIYDILPTKVYVKQAEKFDAIQKEVETAIAKSEFGYQPEWGKTVKLSNFKDWSNCIIDRCEMTSLKEEIYNSVCDYAQRELRYVCNSWIAKYDKGDYAQIHSHYPATYSGCYYYDIGDTDSCHFFFDNDYNRCQLAVENGHIIIFPSHLKHGVTTNETDNSKFTVAFNLAVY